MALYSAFSWLNPSFVTMTRSGVTGRTAHCSRGTNRRIQNFAGPCCVSVGAGFTMQRSKMCSAHALKEGRVKSVDDF